MKKDKSTEKMIVIYKGANILSLPYTDPQGSGTQYIDLKPGNNEVSGDVWAAIKKYNEKRMKHYRTMLVEVAGKAGGVDEVIDVSAMSADKAIEVVKGMTTIDCLETAWKQEQAKKTGPRVTVSKAIDDQMNEVQAFLDKIEEEKKKSEG